MQVTETLNEGLKRELKITVGADELLSKQDARLIELKDTVRLNGFRAGKVPMPHLKKLYGQQAMAEVIEKTVGESTQKVLEDRNEKPAYQPEVKVVDEEKMPTVLAGNADLELNMVFEVIPEIADIDFSTMKLEKLVAEVTDAEVDEALSAIAEQNKDFVPKAEGASLEIGDQATIDFVGKVDGEAFDGGSAEGVPLEIGSNQFIPGFEEQLIGAKAGEQKTINATFPDDYPQASLAGKEAIFDVTVQGVSAPGKSGINDELAQRLGMENLEALKEAVRGQAEGDFEKASGTRLKRTVLDELDKMTSFELPEKMVEQEFEGIWGQVMHDIEHHGKTFEDEGTTEEDARKEYRQISERRIRLG
ncbi:MAG: trigger factor, partial [Rhizobiales bacterium]|nr:trigger factor [Hyphomicrobiales bacterium]